MLDILAPVIINLSNKTLILQNGTVVPVAIGKSNTPTPTGTFSVIRKVKNPAGNFYGSHAILLDKDNIGIHGTNNQNSIGKAASAGCIRVPEWAESQVFRSITFFTPIKIEP